LTQSKGFELRFAAHLCILHAETVGLNFSNVNATEPLLSSISHCAGLASQTQEESREAMGKSQSKREFMRVKKQTAPERTGKLPARSVVAHELSQFPVARADRVADQVYRHLRHAILSEKFKPGERLREIEIAAGLGVSRTPVREAISRLIGDWLVREISTGGVEVVDAAAEIVEIYHIREALEICAGRLAASRITKAQLDKLTALVETGRSAPFKDRVEINQEFHLTIAEASGSARLVAMLRDYREHLLNPRWISSQNSKMAKRAHEHHKKIVVALRAGSPERVEKLLREHLKIGWDQLQIGMKAKT
jgi:DNA-binding GntR family transcriptional regulator